ncbi:MAG: LysR family transcriptional regulator [Lactobacillus sp.]|uniref:LysR family transcriptional regulator n=1 Tax=Bombilactobacillus bombi TaxID=1303590 RepID=A0A347SR94_9LACO|nr:LysR family transcriptional regulator [Bombilactobacillus bombi]AXX64553.1 LysR family transcriptional regulator [Bombilactobacillus bombi]MCO6541302.1 LysR family transcriptional regulator [Lactobacillus sp.]MCO6542886.1 LysR family transcriptional regulator [Lactobacillus sp.]RHW49874.1 LysR family transcriptional regulator [Bombilactobacillus bombi]
MNSGKDDFINSLTSKSLSYFAKLAHTLSYTKTARSLGITQPALTQQIKKLEHGIGTPLFYTVGKQINLTDAGRILLSAVTDIYQTMITAVDNIQKSTMASTGSIRIGLLATIEDQVLEDFIIHYNDLQPEVEIEVSLLTRRALWSDLENNQIDIAIMYLPDKSIKNWKQYCARKIMDERLILLHNNKKWIQKKSLKLKYVTAHPWVTYPNDYYLTELLREHFKNQLIDPPKSQGRFASPLQILRFAQQKNYYAAFPESFVIANQDKIHLYQTPLDPKIKFEMSFIFRHEKSSIPRIANFFECWDEYISKKSYYERLQDYRPM